MPADTGAFFHQVDFKAGGGEIERGLDAAYPATHHHHITKLSAGQIRRKLFNDLLWYNLGFHVRLPLYV